jgi:hypothetical protein
MPVMIGVLSVAGAAWVADERLEWTLVALAAGLAATSARRSGRNWRILWVFGAGLACILTARLGAAPGSWTQATGMLVGGTLIAAGHWQSLRLLRPEAQR